MAPNVVMARPSERTLLILGVTCGAVVILAARIIAVGGVLPKKVAAHNDFAQPFMATIMDDARAAFHK
jgi:hypothetical protein